MSDAAVAERDDDVPPARIRARKNWARRLVGELAALLLGLLVIAAVGVVLLDTAPGHRFVADRIAKVETASGLRIRIGRIEGSIFGHSRLRNVEVYDQRGLFLTSPEIELDWAPGAWLYNNLHVDKLTAERVNLLRLPALKATGRTGPLLPKFDIHIGELRIDQLVLAPAVTGSARTGSVQGSADIRAGRVMAKLQVALDRGGDRMMATIDADPDRNRFDIDVRLQSPANGLVPALVGSKRSIALVVEGEGGWTAWRGSALLDMSGKPTARLGLTARNGRYGLSGEIAPAQFLKGKLMRLTSPRLRVRGDATFRDRVLDGRLTLGSPSLRAVAEGELDLATGAYRGVTVGLDLLRPAALFPNMSGRNIRMLWTLDGPYASARYAYRLTSPAVRFDQTGFVDVRAEGRGKFSPWPMRVPLQLSARAITGVGDVAGAILANVRVEGMLTVTPKLVRGDSLQLTSARLKGKMSLLIDLVTGRFEVLLSGGLTRYLIDGLGIVDVVTDLRVEPGPGGKGSHVVGSAKAWVRRLDNSFFLSLTGGLPRIETNLERGGDGVLHFSNLQLYSPSLRLSGSGRRNRDGTFHIVASGRQAQYGPVRLVLDGRIERPRVQLFLERPNDSLGIRNMTLSLQPTAAGFDYLAKGQSTLGEFTSNGRILIPRGGRTVISVAALNVGGTTASGDLRSDPGGFTGQLTLAGGGVSGTLGFRPENGAQRIDAHLAADNASFPGVLAVRSGRLDGSILLADGRTTLNGVVNARGVQAGGMSFSRFVANARLVNGEGQVRAAVAGRRNSAFDFTAVADVAADSIRVAGRGSLDGKPLILQQTAVLTRAGDGWSLAPTRFAFAGGTGILSARTGSKPEVHAVLRNMPLQVLDVVVPKLGLSGSATGRLDYAWAGQRSGRANLTIRGLSRSGLALSSRPIDLGLNAVIDRDRAALRAVAISDGKPIGRVQARFAPIGNGPVVAALLNAPLFAQLRYAGPADTLWRLTGTELFDLSGQVAIGADIGGRLADPEIRGSLKANGARLESAVTGTVINQLVAEARFEGPRILFSRLGGQTPGGGSIEGRGTVTFSGGRSALDLAFTANKALLLDRDDIAARVTGPLTVRSNGQGGTISGTFALDQGLFTLGRASSAAGVPRLQVTHRGLDPEDVIELSDLRPWKLDIKLAGHLDARGLGIESRWNTDLRIGGTADAPRFVGRADLIRGDYDFAGRTFRLEHGVLRFRGESPPDPLLDIRAEAQVQGLDAAVRVGGTGLHPEISFTSVPALPQDELLSRLLFGTSITNLSAPEALQLASAVAALQSGSGGLDPINAIRKAVGLDRFRIVPADVATGQKTAIAAGKYITRKLYVEVITDGQGYSATRAEYQVTRWLSLLSSISTIGRTSANVRVSKDY